MLLTPTEMERLVIFTAAEMARRRRERGLKLNHPEVIAFITDALLEGAREGRTLADLMGWGSTLLTTDDVLPGVAALVPLIAVEGLFPDGTKMIVVHEPIRPGRAPVEASVTPGEIIPGGETIELNAGRRTASVRVLNTGDRPVQVGSHMHFFEANAALEFDRATAFGMRLDVPAGASARFEPGESKDVILVAFGGAGPVTGFNRLTEGSLHDPAVRERALAAARARGFRSA